MSYLPGTPGPDTLVGSGGPDTLDGFAGDDVLDGRAGDDVLNGWQGHDLLLGGDGNDSLQGDLLGSGGNDTLIGGAGTDTARYQLAGPSPGQGASFDASAIGTAEQLDFADGHGGVDRLESIEQVEVVGSAFADRIIGSAGNDWLRGEEGDDFVAGGTGHDQLWGGSGNDTLHGGDGNDDLRGGEGDDLLDGGAGNDTLHPVWGSNTLLGGLGLDTVHYNLRQAPHGVRVDLAALGDAGHVWVDHGLGGGVDRLESIEQLEFYGSDFDDTVAGGPGDDLLHGYAGHDTVRFQGRASEYGWVYNQRTGGITVVDSVPGRDGSDRIFGFETFVFADTVMDLDAMMASAFPLANTTPVRIFRVAQDGSGRPGVDNLLSGGSSIFVWGEAARSGVTLSTSFATAETLRNDLTGDLSALPFPTQWIEYARRAMQAVASVADVRFVEWDDRGARVGEVRWLAEFDPDASWSASGGLPGLGYGAGNLRVNVPRMPTADPGLTGLLMHELGHALGLVHPHDALWPAPVEEDQLRYSLMSYRGFAGGPLYQYGTHFPTTLMPNDIRALQWLYGANVQSRAGDDVYRWASGQPVYETIYDTGGQDTIDASDQVLGVQLSLQAGAWSTIGAAFFDGQAMVRDRLVIFDGTVIENAIGSAFDDLLTGNAAHNRLVGGAGDDTLEGAAGDDTLDGGTGADRMLGGSGNDHFFVDHSDDDVVETAGGGVDTVWTRAASYTLPPQVENGGIVANGQANLTGNGLGNLLFAGPGDNRIDGGAGTDTVSYARMTAGVTVNLASTGPQLTGGSGTDTLIGIENLDGSNFADWLIGDSNANVLDGGPGADRMDGGAGNDTYVVDDAGDLTIETSADPAEIDTVHSSVTRALGANLENLVLTGNDAINGSGNALDNRITGNGAANQLFGGSGHDTLVGGSGADTLNGGPGADRMEGGFGGDVFIVDDPGDLVIELPGQGTDRVSTALSYTLPANVEQLTLTGTGNVDGTGNELPNLLQGNAGNNRLSGGAGNDTLTGGAGDDTLDGGTGADYMVGQEGDDTYIVDASGDQTIESFSTFGIDTVIASVNRTLSTNIENLVLTGAALVGAGNALGNVITGNALANSLLGVEGDDTLIGGEGHDTLNGGSGADRMEGGPGDDVYAVDNANDVVIELPGEGIDRVSSTVNWTLGANVENLTLAGTAAISGTGNELANVITGNAAANAIDGGAGDDTLGGGEGDDTLTGGPGSDRLTSGPGADVFRFVTTGDGPDTITDFARGTDRIMVVAANFGLVAGSTANLVINGTPTSAAAVFLYTSATGSLAFDADGSGPGAALTLAMLGNRPATLLPVDIALGP